MHIKRLTNEVSKNVFQSKRVPKHMNTYVQMHTNIQQSGVSKTECLYRYKHANHNIRSHSYCGCSGFPPKKNNASDFQNKEHTHTCRYTHGFAYT